MTTCVAKKFARYLRHIRAVSALEYAILVGIIALVISAAIVTLSGNITPVVKAVVGQDRDGNSYAGCEIVRTEFPWTRPAVLRLKEEAMTTCVAKKFARYLRNTRAVSALEYAIVVGITVVVVFAAYETFHEMISRRRLLHLPGH